MPRAGVSARPTRRPAAPWWEELEREAFRFPAAREVPPREARSREMRPRQVPPREEHPREIRPREMRAREVRAAQRPKRPVPNPEAPAPVAPLPAPASVSQVDGRRKTVTIRGHGAERNLPVARPTLRRHERPGFRPDRMALWAVLLGLILIVVAAASAHGAVLH